MVLKDVTNKSIYWKLFPLLVAGVLACSAGAWFGIPMYLERGVKIDAVANAQNTVKQFKILRSYYTKNVIKKVLASKALKPTYTHKDTPGEVPLPATLIHDLSELLAEAGTSLRLYSPYPFPLRANRTLDDFGKSAWDALATTPDQPFVRTEIQGDREVVRVGVADTMGSQVCVNCHNSRSDTPKDDWKLNDLWGVLEISTDVSDQIARGVWTGRGIALALVAVLGAVLLLAFFRMRGVVLNPVKIMSEVIRTLATGDHEIEVPEKDRVDEIGEMAQAVQVFKENAIEAEGLRREQEKAEADKRRMEDERRDADAQAEEEKRQMEEERRQAEQKAEEEAREAEKRAEEERKQALLKLADDFEGSVKGVVETVSSAATEMQSTAQSMSSIAEETSNQSTTVASAAEQASANVQTVASAAEELSASVQEVGRQVTKSSEIAGRAVDEANSTHETVRKLAESAQKIGDVVQLITDIAEQTNLLALNATIEAARAGDAGKGFAVVASEVKSLASQTSKATDEIDAQIGEVQDVTQTAVEAIEGISGTIGEINEIATTIASAVEEQGAATQEIARNTQQAATGTQEVTSNITGVTQAAGEAGAAASQVLSSAGQLTEESEVLRKEVDSFVSRIRTA